MGDGIGLRGGTSERPPQEKPGAAWKALVRAPRAPVGTLGKLRGTSYARAMRVFAAAMVCVVLSSASVEAQEGPSGSALDPNSYVALSADELAQISLGGFRSYLERIRAGDALLYRQLDPRLDSLEERELAADVVFWVGTGLGIAALASAIPVYLLVREERRDDPTIGLIVAGLSTFVLGVIIQAIIRPAHGDLVQLIDLHDELVGRR